jgi:SM-20-related protein
MNWPHVLVPDFLEPGFVGELLDHVQAFEASFAESTVSTSDRSYRQSAVLYDFPQAEAFRFRVRSMLGYVLPRLGLAPFAPTEIECQLTGHNDGHYFKAHNDSGSPDTASRILTYVYYFHLEPKAYDGGEFRMLDGGEQLDLVPAHNSILFFPCHQMHEVRPVRCSSRRFADGRFTVNGWIRG